MRQIVILAIRAYRLILSPFVGQHCRFTPSCSEYALESVKKYGSIHGSWLAIKRLSRCHPWHAGGYDPVPTNKKEN